MVPRKTRTGKKHKKSKTTISKRIREKDGLVEPKDYLNGSLRLVSPIRICRKDSENVRCVESSEENLDYSNHNVNADAVEGQVESVSGDKVVQALTELKTKKTCFSLHIFQ